MRIVHCVIIVNLIVLCSSTFSLTKGSKLSTIISKGISQSLGTRKLDIDRQGGIVSTLLAGPVFLALSTILLPVLPLLFLAPLAFAGFGPSFNTVNDAIDQLSGQNSPLTEALSGIGNLIDGGSNAIGGSTSGSQNTGQSNNKPALAASDNKPTAATSDNKPAASAPKPAFASAPSKPLSGAGFSGNNIFEQLTAAFADDGGGEGLFPLFSAATSSGSSSNDGGNGGADSLQALAANTLNSISNFLFSRKRSEPHLRHPVYGAMQRYPLKNSRPGIVKRLKEAFYTLRNGLRRYEIHESECQQRLICELQQKAFGKQLKSWAPMLLEAIGFENHLERSNAFGSGAKSYIKTFYKALRHGLTENECAEIFSKCPVNIAVEPNTNSILHRLLRRKQHKTTWIPQYGLKSPFTDLRLRPDNSGPGLQNFKRPTLKNMFENNLFPKVPNRL